MVTCPTCGVDGVCYVLASHVTAPVYTTGPLAGFAERPCSVCDGTGEILDARAAWMAEGAKLRAFRDKRDMSLREAARWLGVSPVEWSDAEHGKIDPNPVRTLAATRAMATRRPEEDET